MTSTVGHSRQKLPKNPEKDRFDNYFSAFRKMQGALFTCYSHKDTTMT